MTVMDRRVTALTYLCALAAAAVLSLTSWPVKLSGIGFLIVALGIPVAWKIASEGSDGYVRAQPLALAVEESTHVMTGGTMGGYYIDIDLLLTDPSQVRAVGRRYVAEIRTIQRAVGRIDRLVFIERDAGPVGAIGLLGYLSAESGIPSVIVRPRRLLISGEIKPLKRIGRGMTVVIVTDVVTRGGHIRAVVQTLQRHIGPGPYHAVALVCREDQAAKDLRQDGVQVHPLYDQATLRRVLDEHKASAVHCA